MATTQYTHEELAEMALLYADALDMVDMFTARGPSWSRHAAEWQTAADALASKLIGAGCVITSADFVNWGKVNERR